MRTHLSRKAQAGCACALLFTLLMSGCNPERQQAKKVANRFMKECLAEPNVRNCRFSKLDSTFVLSDGMMEQMRASAQGNELFRSDLSFGDATISRPVYYISSTYDDPSGTSHRITFYFNQSLDEVLAVKAY